MKKSILLAAAFVALIATSCRKIEMDGGTNVIQQPTTPGVQTITLKGRIAKDTVLREGNNYILSGIVYIVNNAKITIQPGVTVKADYTGANVAALVITRGAQIIADGTQEKPIVFTSNSPTPRSGDWGGIVICGRASINSTFTGVGGGAGTLQVEGGIDNSFGDGIAGGGATPNDDDNSGILRYVRIEYAGYAYQPDKEINSLTMAAVGRGTVIDFVQVTYGKDDAFEWFGGTVNCKHLIAYKTQDDDFDADNGYSGKVQFGIVLRDSTIADISRSEAFECDNDPSGSINRPQTTAVFSNITVVGPRATLANRGNSLYLGAAHLRRNTQTCIYNSVMAGYPVGLLIDASTTEANATNADLQFRNNVLSAMTDTLATVNGSTFDITSFFNTSGWGNTKVNGVADLYIHSFSLTNPDFTPYNASPLMSGADFTNSNLTSGFEVVTYKGAFGSTDWTNSWTNFDPQNTVY